ncbi:hypothetical protein H257_14285 [Aphanomyces astaci]|uniref:Peptidase M14 domain-containing protein n=1 Tax=Aphanomyces astaci TaxID=112090 RepID=W4FRK7_APHAT|nr:hypothetical protein H257_14285 [Aphanomyces astaci]ETV70125.1 hypothetical protein H257_14285 [Aphanomyces astaci]|eukprot:XP_009840356.1 hypothetical protein H257_14285 [Aphanomyces astaci]
MPRHDTQGLSMKSLGANLVNRRAQCGKQHTTSMESANQAITAIQGPLAVAILSSPATAREWISGSSILFSLASILDDIANKKSTTADEYDLYFVPIVNIDGFEMTWNGTRLQRKSANEVDLNRNWPTPFGTPTVTIEIGGRVFTVDVLTIPIRGLQVYNGIKQYAKAVTVFNGRDVTPTKPSCGD